ncbi:MAG: hypothetical protein V3T83_01795 [Acidobacteriota bacterium]
MILTRMIRSLRGRQPAASPAQGRLSAALPRAAPFTFAKIDPPLDNAGRELLEILAEHLPARSGSLPDHSLALAEVNEKTVGLGSLRGVDRRVVFNLAELKGLRLDALIRFQLWFEEPGQAEVGLNNLNLSLMNERDGLRATGVLRLKLESSSPPERVAPIEGWRIVANFRVLYEHHYQDSGGAESLIAQIPIGCELEEGVLQTTTVTDEIVRWDKLDAPALQVTGASARRIGGLAVLRHPPSGPTSGEVTLARLDLASGQAPSLAGSLMEFVQRVTDQENPATNIRFSDSLEQFLQAEPFFAARERRQDGEAEPAAEIRIELGDRDKDGLADEYGLRLLPFGSPLKLPRPEDVFRLKAQFDPDSDAVLYIRASRGVLSAPIQPDSQ